MKYLIFLLAMTIGCAHHEVPVQNFTGSSISFFKDTMSDPIKGWPINRADTMAFKYGSVHIDIGDTTGKWWSLEPDYKPGYLSRNVTMYADTPKGVTYVALESDWMKPRGDIIREFYIYHDTSRLWSITLIRDTAYIMPTAADTLFKQCKVIEVAGRVFELVNQNKSK